MFLIICNILISELHRCVSSSGSYPEQSRAEHFFFYQVFIIKNAMWSNARN